jgi:hypothetical protein
MPDLLVGWGLTNFLPQLALNCDPPDLHLLSSWDYRNEPPLPAWYHLLTSRVSLHPCVRVEMWKGVLEI